MSGSEIETSDSKIAFVLNGQTGVISGTALASNLKDKQSTVLLCTVSLFIKNAFGTWVKI